MNKKTKEVNFMQAFDKSIDKIERLKSEKRIKTLWKEIEDLREKVDNSIQIEVFRKEVKEKYTEGMALGAGIGGTILLIIIFAIGIEKGAYIYFWIVILLAIILPNIPQIRK